MTSKQQHVQTQLSDIYVFTLHLFTVLSYLIENKEWLTWKRRLHHQPGNSWGRRIKTLQVCFNCSLCVKHFIPISLSNCGNKPWAQSSDNTLHYTLQPPLYSSIFRNKEEIHTVYWQLVWHAIINTIIHEKVHLPFNSRLFTRDAVALWVTEWTTVYVITTLWKTVCSPGGRADAQ